MPRDRRDLSAQAAPARHPAAEPDSGCEAVGFQQRVRLRRAPAESDETLQRRAACAYAQEFVAEACSGGGVDDVPAFTGVLFERAEGVRRQHLGPQITVVTGGVTARKDVRERMRET